MIAATVNTEAITMKTEAAVVKFFWKPELTCEPISFLLLVNFIR
jgi:hypothetical protein